MSVASGHNRKHLSSAANVLRRLVVHLSHVRVCWYRLTSDQSIHANESQFFRYHRRSHRKTGLDESELTSSSYVHDTIAGQISAVLDREDDGKWNASGATLMASR